jgi:hypothetical protein
MIAMVSYKGLGMIAMISIQGLCTNNMIDFLGRHVCHGWYPGLAKIDIIETWAVACLISQTRINVIGTCVYY